MRLGKGICAAVLLALSGVALAAAPPAHPPARVMSISLCTDQLLLDLLPPARITSVTYLSRPRDGSYMNPQALKVGVNDGIAEDVVRQRPDLVLAGTYTTPATRQLLKAVGIPVLEVPPANDFQTIREQVRSVGHALGADARANELIQHMDATLARLAATAPAHPATLIGWNGGGAVPGRGTLFDAIVTAAGAVNLGAGLQSSRFDVERLLLTRPDLLAVGDDTVAAPALQSAPLTHPLVRRLYAGREIVYPEMLYNCGLPQSADAAVQIRRAMLATAARGPAS